MSYYRCMIVNICIFLYISEPGLSNNHSMIQFAAEDPWNIDAYLVHERAHVYSMELRDPQVGFEVHTMDTT